MYGVEGNTLPSLNFLGGPPGNRQGSLCFIMSTHAAIKAGQKFFQTGSAYIHKKAGYVRDDSEGHLVLAPPLA